MVSNFIPFKAKEEDVKVPVNILVVDDTPANIIALKSTLEPLQENIMHASSGEEALRYLLDNEFVVILLDVNMPGIDGFETARLIRGHKKLESLPIIFVTAMEDTQSRIIKAYTIGAVDYIVKPYNADIVLSKVKVFVDLYRMNQELLIQKEREVERQKEKQQEHENEKRRLKEIDLLKIALAQQQRMAGEESCLSESSLTGKKEKSLDSALLRKRNPDAFFKLETGYISLLEKYLEAIAFDDVPPRNEIKVFAENLAELQCGARDLILLHLDVVRTITNKVSTKRANVYCTEGRLLALESMGYLADCYRLRQKLHGQIDN